MEGASLAATQSGNFFTNYILPYMRYYNRNQTDDYIGQYLQEQIVSSENGTEFVPPHVSKETQDLFEILWELQISTNTVVYQSSKAKRDEYDESVYCKNLFLKDRHGQFYLVLCTEDEKVDLRLLKRKLGAYRNFSFASNNDIENLLGVKSGGITPLALLKETAKEVKLAAFGNITSSNLTLNFHPLDSRYATRMSFLDLQKFLKSIDREIHIIH